MRALSITVPRSALLLSSSGDSETTLTVSVIATGYTVGFTLSCIVTPKFVLRVGHVRVFTALITLLSIAILLCGLIVDWHAWIVFRAIAGFAISGSYLVIESWLNERVTNENRGLLFSLYLITTMVGTIGGQYMVPLGDPTNTSLFMLCSVLFSLALLPTALSSSPMPAPPAQAKFDIPALFRRSPVAVVGGFLAGALSGAWLNLGGVFTQKIGLSTAEGATLLASLLTGSAVSQIPIGRLSDKIDRRIVMVGCGMVGVVSCLVMSASIGSQPAVLYVIAALVGSVLFPIYALNVAHANDLAKPNEYVETSSGLMITYGLGTISGPLMVGPVMDRFGPAALFLVLATAPLEVANWWLARTQGHGPALRLAMSCWLPAMLAGQVAAGIVLSALDHRHPGVLRPLHYLAGLGVGPVFLLFFVQTHFRTLSWQARVAQANQRAETADMARRLAEARLAVLQAQIEPHFLFNTLATVQYLVKSDPVAADFLLSQLTRYLRLVMPSMRQLSSTLGREFELTEAYLQIAKLRMGGRLDVEVDLPAALEAAEFPSMVLQTLVENAIKHGVEPKPGPVRIRVFARQVGDELHVGVQDDGVGLGGAQTKGSGTGLQNIRERLQGIHGERAQLHVAGLADGGVLATVVVPLEKQ